MELTSHRYSSGKESTLSILQMDGAFECYVLEDEFRCQKVWGETRIPAGRYEIKLRTEGGFHQKYTTRFGRDFHKGMLELQNVPGFEHILIHIGNTDADTAGCLIVGQTANNNQVEKGFVGNSTEAYTNLYPAIAEKLLKGEKVFIQIKDRI